MNPARLLELMNPMPHTPSPYLDPEALSMISPMRLERFLHNGFTGTKYAKRKSRSKIAKESKKRNRR